MTTPVGTEEPQDVSWSYWPVNYLNGDPTVITNAPFPLSGVQFSVVARGVGEMRASVQLADETVRTMKPWELFVPRITGIVAVRTVKLSNGQLEHTAPFHGILWNAPTDPQTGRMECLFQTVESLWARRLITGPPPLGLRDPATGIIRPSASWTNADQAQIVRDLLNPAFFSQLGNIPGIFPAWITVEAPATNMGVPRTDTYRRGSETNLLTAHQERSKRVNGYEWYTAVRVLSGTNAYNASSFRVQMVTGYPRLGRRYADGTTLPRFSYHIDGRGNVAQLSYAYSGQSVSNMVWGTGSGTDDEALRVSTSNSADWRNGFLLTEDKYSNPDVSDPNTLQQQTDAKLIQGYANERYVDSVTVRGDLFPYFDTYAIGDDCLFSTDDWTWPDNADGSRGVTYISRIMGWKVTPPEGDQSELVQILLGGREEVDG